jgi:hypothetical protein
MAYALLEVALYDLPPSSVEEVIKRVRVLLEPFATDVQIEMIEHTASVSCSAPTCAGNHREG